MGRRPNPLVEQFFARGIKLDDTSNRYKQTCKRCGVLFPKGRIDVLMTHILRRCPYVSHDERAQVYHLLHPTPPTTPRTPNPTQIKEVPDFNIQSPGHFQPDGQQIAPEHTNLPPPDIPFELMDQQSQQSTALDTLAEVSRRHMDISSQRVQYEQEHGTTHHDDAQAFAEQALFAQLYDAGVGTSAPQSGGLYTYAPETSQPEQNGQNFRFDETSPVNGEDTASPLEGNHSGGSNHVEYGHTPASEHPQDTSLDPQLDDLEARLTAHLVASLNAPDSPAPVANELRWTPAGYTRSSDFATMMESFENDGNPPFGVLHTFPKGKGRNRFNDTRRKQVGDMRKYGACLRCRMLKKPCSAGNPCQACQTVDSARIWKGACIRTKLAEEFTLWSTGLFQSQARLAIPPVIDNLRQTILPGRLEVRLFSSSDFAMTFVCKQYTNAPTSNKIIHPTMGTVGEEHQSIWLLEEGEFVSEQLEDYIKQVTTTCIEEETSTFLRNTLQQGQILMREEAGQPMSTTPTGRTCDNLHTQLVTKVIELWAMTRILAAPHDAYLEVRYDRTQTRRGEPIIVDWLNLLPPINCVDESTPSVSVIRHQLLAVIESRCSALSKKIMNELERRLMQRQQVSKFATLLSAVIFLNCVERMTGFFRAYDVDINSAQIGGLLHGMGSRSQRPWGSTTHLLALGANAKWALDDPPVDFWPQGDRFASLLIMLLRMRALPPVMTLTTEGALATFQAFPWSQDPKDIRKEQERKIVGAWLDPLELKLDDWVAVRDREAPSPEAGICEWESRFVSRIILPVWSESNYSNDSYS